MFFPLYAVFFLVAAHGFLFLTLRDFAPVSLAIIAIYLLFAPFAFARAEHWLKGFTIAVSLYALAAVTVPQFASIALVGVAALGGYFSAGAIAAKPPRLAEIAILVISAGLLTVLLVPEALRLQLPYQHPDNVVSGIMGGFMENDGVFGMSVVNMIARTGVPSTGLHGVPLLHYHNLGFVLMALVKRVAGVPVYEVHYYVIPFIVLPLVVALMEFVIWTSTAKRLPVAMLPLLMFGLYGRSLGEWTVDMDASFPAGVFVCMAAVFVLSVRRQSYWTTICLVPLAFQGKISIGLVLAATIGLCIALDSSVRWKQKAGLVTWLAVLSALGVYLTLDLFLDAPAQYQWSWLVYYNEFRSKAFPSFFDYFVYSLAPFLLFLAILIPRYWHIGFRRWFADNWLLMAFFAVAFAGAGVAINIYQSGGSNHSFIAILNWIALPFLVIALATADRFRTPIAVGLAVLAMSCALKAADSLQKYSDYEAQRRASLAAILNNYKIDEAALRERQERFLPYFNALREIGRHPETFDGFVVHIPETEHDFWDHSIMTFSRFWMPFSIPILAEQPAWLGYDPALMPPHRNIAWYPPGSYGYSSYYGNNGREVCRDSLYEGVLELSKDPTGAVAIKRVRCTE